MSEVSKPHSELARQVLADQKGHRQISLTLAQQVLDLEEQFEAELNWAKGNAADAIAEANRYRSALREIAEADAKTPVLSLNRIAQRVLGEDDR